MKASKIIILFVLAGLLSSVVAGCAPAATPTAEVPAASPTSAAPAATPVAATPTVVAPPVGGELIVGLSTEPSKIDPQRTAADNGFLPIMQACETLVFRTPDATYAPGLATSWEISEDGLDYTFHLREGVKFHDGTPFNAEAVKYTFDRILDPNLNASGQAQSAVGTFREAEIVDDYTVILHLDSPFAPFMDAVVGPETCMVSPTVAAEWGPDEFQDHFVGTGPFIFKEWVRGEYIRLERNPDYWGGPEFFDHQGLAYLDAIVFKFVPEASVRTGALETGEIQMAQEVSAVDVERLDARPDIDILVRPSSGQPLEIFFNALKAPLDDLKVRQAIEYAVDQKAVSDILYQGVLGPAYGPFSPSTPCYWSGAEQMYPYDQAKAESLLEEAGWIDTDGDGIRDKDGQALQLTMSTHGSFPLYRDPCPILETQLAEVGIDLVVTEMAAPAWLEASKNGQYHIGISDWRISDPSFALHMYACDPTTNSCWTWHDNTHLNDILQEATAVTDPEERCALYEEAQQIVMEEAYVKPINLSSAVLGVRTEVKGLKLEPLRTAFFWAFDVYLEE